MAFLETAEKIRVTYTFTFHNIYAFIMILITLKGTVHVPPGRRSHAAARVASPNLTNMTA
ncbi:hypothetical protein F5877DRAFT_86942 [Lentinula edodes]|nr:hypothetical protein F5877DRAFT_86942 [Lentinula edodes]